MHKKNAQNRKSKKNFLLCSTFKLIALTIEIKVFDSSYSIVNSVHLITWSGEKEIILDKTKLSSYSTRFMVKQPYTTTTNQQCLYALKEMLLFEYF